MGKGMCLKISRIALTALMLVFVTNASFAGEADKEGMPAWVKTSLVIGTTAGLYAFDEDIQQWAQEKRGITTDEIASCAKPFGGVLQVASSLGVLYVYGHFGEDARAERTALMGIESLLVTGIITQTLKYAGHRHRPSSGEQYNTWDGPSMSTANHSFPSGHASTAFSVLTVVASEYDDYPFIPPLAYSIATLTALSRVNDNKHWASDVFFGSALGYYTAKAVVGFHEKDGEVVFYPVVNRNGGLLVVSYAF
jgi:hypothetical protein